jgi:hypothetical protein
VTEDAEVVCDGNVITSRQPSDLGGFCREILSTLEVVMNHESTQVPKEDTQAVEEKLERLTQEASQLINTANKEERETLREYAINLLQEETETSQMDRRVAGDAARKASFNPLALALPLALAGGILFFLFPALGIVLLAAAAMAVLWGILRPLLYRQV